MHVRLNYGPYQGQVRDLRHDVALAAIAAGRAVKAEYDPASGEFIAPAEPEIATPAAPLKPSKGRK
jgi:hypothetical protein